MVGIEYYMEINKLQKIFGVGPMGAVISLLLLALFAWADSMMKLPVMVAYTGLMKSIGVALIILGLGLHFWSFSTLRNWWADNKLCTKGPFKHFRHPMYAAWITFVCPGVALYLNSWLYLFWLLLLQIIWHKFVKKEEIIMIDTFGEDYIDYARQTGRFFPKMLN